MARDPEKAVPKLEKMFPLEKYKDVNLSELTGSVDQVEITSYKEKEGAHTLGDALKVLISDGDDEEEKQKIRMAVLSRAVANGYNVNLVYAGDKFSINDGTLFIEKANGSKYNINLVDAGDYEEEGYTRVQKRDDVKEHTQRAWHSLKEAFDSGVLYDIMRALGYEFNDEARSEIWSDMQGNAGNFKAYAKGSDKKNLNKLAESFDKIGLDDDYKKTGFQNRAMVEYLKWAHDEELEDE